MKNRDLCNRIFAAREQGAIRKIKCTVELADFIVDVFANGG